MRRRARYCYGKSPVRLSVRDVEYHDQIGWNTSKIISPLVSLRVRSLQTSTSRIYSKRNTGILAGIGVGTEKVAVGAAYKSSNISEMRQESTKVIV